MFEDSKEIIADVEQHCKNKDEEIIKLNRILGDFKVGLDKARTEADKLKDDNYDLKKFYNVEAIEKLQSDYLNTVAKLKSTEEIIDTHRATYKELNQALSEKAKEINELNKKLEYYKVTTEKVNSLIIEVDIYKNKIKELENERDNYKADRDLFQSAYDFHMQKIKELEIINSEQSKIIEDYKSQVEDLQKQVDVVESVKKARDEVAFKLTNRVAEVVNLKNEIKKLTEERDDALLKASLLRGAENQLHSNASAYGQIKTENGVLRSKLQEYINEIKDLKLKLSSATAYENERKQEVELLKQKVEDLQGNYDAARKDVKIWVDINNNTAKHFTESKALVARLRRKNRRLKNKLEEAIEDFAKYVSEHKPYERDGVKDGSTKTE